MKQVVPFFVCLLLGAAATAQTPVKQENVDVSFPYDSYQLTPDITADLDHLFSEMPPKGWIHLNITGDISKKGGKWHRNTIASKRADAVRDYFLSKGIPANNVYINKSFRSKRKYVTVAHKGAKSAEDLYEVRVYNPASKKNVEYTQSTMDENAGKQEQCYVINPLKADSVWAPEGTVLRFDPLVFEFLNGQEVREEVVICIREYYSIADIVANDLATISSKRMLETGGMLYITATCKGYEVRIKKGKSYVIRMPAREVLPRMKIFAGQEKGGIVDWKETDIRNIPAVTTAIVEPSDSTETFYAGEGNFLDGVYYERQIEISAAEYAFNATGLGWINCDRFPPTVERTNMVVKVDTSQNISVRLVFKDIRSVMPAYHSGVNMVKFEGIPLGEAATLIGYKMDDKKNVYVAAKDIRIPKDGVEGLDLVATTLDEFKQYLKTLEK
jgi:hypothetical protein